MSLKNYVIGTIQGCIEAYLRGNQTIEWAIGMIKHAIRSGARKEDVIKIIEKYKKTKLNIDIETKIEKLNQLEEQVLKL